MTEIFKRLMPGMAIVAAIGGFMLWSWAAAPRPEQVKAAVVKSIPQPAWKPDPRIATLDGIVRDLEKDNGGLRLTLRERDLSVEALKAEVARLDWLLKTKASAEKQRPKKTSARKCPPLKTKE